MLRLQELQSETKMVHFEEQQMELQMVQAGWVLLRLPARFREDK